MIYPPMASLLKRVDSRYTLVVAVARRARMLTDGCEKLTNFQSSKDVTTAIHEINEGQISYHRPAKQDAGAQKAAAKEPVVQEDTAE